MRSRRLAALLFVGLGIISFSIYVHGEVPDVPTGQWLAGPALAQPRTGAVSVVLDDGRVLVIGGRTANGPVSTVDVFGTDGSLTAGAPLLSPRSGHAAAKLADGRVIVVGGTSLVETMGDNGPVTAESVTNSAELFDPLTNSWYPAASLSTARSGHTATALSTGPVLIAGGAAQDGAALDSFEVFDPEAGVFSSGGLLSAARIEHAAAAAGGSKVLVAGGRNTNGVLATADIVDVDSGTVTTVVLTAARAGASATTLLDGRVLVAGGFDGVTDLESAEVVDPLTGFSLPTGSMPQGRHGHNALLLADNNTVLISGGTSGSDVVATAVQFIPWMGQFLPTADPAFARTSALLSNLSNEGVALLALGRGGDRVAVGATELYGFATLKTDKNDYPPGTPVVVTGSGWQPGGVTLVLHEVGTGHADRTYSAVADGSGRFQNSDFVPDISHVGVRFYLTARGGGLEAQTTFTDASSIKVKQGPTGLSITSPAGAGDGIVNTSQTFVLQSIINSSNGVSWSDVAVTVSVPAGWTKSADPAPFSLAQSSDSAPLTWNVTAPAGAVSGANLTVNVSGTPSSGGCSGGGSNTCSDSRTVKVDVVNPGSLTINGLTAQETGQPLTDTTVNTGGSVTVNLAVLNDESNPAAVVNVPAPVLGVATVAATASATCSAGTPAQRSVSGGQTRTFTYTCVASGSGTLKFSAAANGTDENTGAIVATGSADSNVITVVGADSTPPVITPTVTGTVGSNGWYVSGVTVSWSVTDPDSAVSNSTGCTEANITEDTAGTTLTCSATSTGGTSSQSVTIKRDTTAPIASASPTPLPNANGWNNTNVTVTFTGVDGLSGMASCSIAVVLATDGAGQSASGTCIDQAGNVSAPATASGINIDKTAPTASASRTPAPNANGWNNTDVTVSFTGSDTGSDIDFCSAPVTLSTEGAGQSASGTCTDNAGNVSASATASDINIDKTAPVITFVNVSPAANANGWHNTDVTVTWSCSDALSNVLSSSASQTLTTEGAHQSATGTCEDKAGNSASDTKTEINIDKTAPTTSASRTPEPNANGWNNTDVIVSFTGIDTGGSDIDFCSAPVTLSTEGASQSASGTCTDNAGNVSASATATVNIDKTAPTASASRTPAPNANGWNNTDVTVSFTGSDTGSDIDFCSAPVTLSTEGAGQSVSGTCTDKAGNVSTPVTKGGINIDKTAPSLNPTVSPTPVLLNGSAAVSSGAIDPLSGVATQSCDALDTSSVGSKTVACTVTDKAGNTTIASAPYSVQYMSGGNCLGAFGHQILQPVNPDGSSVFKKGSTVPAKFRVCDANGASIGMAGVVTSFRLVQSGVGTVSDVDEAVISTTPDVTFRWSPNDQLWIFNMNTKSLSSNNTYVYRITLNDGGTTIDFRFGLK